MKDARLAAAAGLAAGAVLHMLYCRYRKARDDLVIFRGPSARDAQGARYSSSGII